MSTLAARLFREAIRGTDAEVDLFGAAMAIAHLGGHEPDPHGTARQLDLFAEAVRDAAGDTLDPHRLAAAIDHELFVVQGFIGNAMHYGDPENSYLDRVVARRTGLPITLSLVYMEVAARVGLRCDGIGYPGHFIVRCGPPEDALYVDPFHQGQRIDREELLAGLRGRDLGGASPEMFLAAVTRRQILQRMLHNLRAVYSEAGDHARWLAAVDLLLELEPWNAGLLGERGMLRYRLGDPERALEDLEGYARANPALTAHRGALRLLEELRTRFRRSQEGKA